MWCCFTRTYTDVALLPLPSCVSLLYWCCLTERYLPRCTLPYREPKPVLYICRQWEVRKIMSVTQFLIKNVLTGFATKHTLPVLVHCGVRDGQGHHGHAVHVIWYTLWLLHITVHPAGSRDPLQATTTTTHKSLLSLFLTTHFTSLVKHCLHQYIQTSWNHCSQLSSLVGKHCKEKVQLKALGHTFLWAPCHPVQQCGPLMCFNRFWTTIRSMVNNLGSYSKKTQLIVSLCFYGI